MESNCAIIVRSCYPRRMKFRERWRLRRLFDSLNNQTDTDFIVYILCHELYGKKGLKSNIDDMRRLCYDLNFEVRFEDPPKHHYEIECRIDNDDLVAPNYIERIRQLYEINCDTFCINFQPVKMDEETKKLYHHEQQYNYEGTSMFLVLVQKEEKKHYVYDRPHIRMAKEVGAVVMGGEGFCFLVCHSDNQLSKINGTEKEWKG